MGKISPVGLLAKVTAQSGLVSFSSAVSLTGDFLIKGLPAGIYVVTVTPASPKVAVVQTNITVVVGAATNIGTVTIL